MAENGLHKLSRRGNIQLMSLKNTGEVLYDLPSPYVPHACGLLHLPRFLAKIKKHLAGQLPPSYQRNFTKGFDGFLCLHLGIEPQQVVDIVRTSKDDVEIDTRLKEIMPKDLLIHKWNRELVQRGMRGLSREKLEEVKAQMGAAHRTDLVYFADVIEYDEDRIE